MKGVAPLPQYFLFSSGKETKVHRYSNICAILHYWVVTVHFEYRKLWLHRLALITTVCNLVFPGKFWINYSNLYFIPSLLSSHHICIYISAVFLIRENLVYLLKNSSAFTHCFFSYKFYYMNAFPICIHSSSGNILFRFTKKKNYFFHCMPNVQSI